MSLDKIQKSREEDNLRSQLSQVLSDKQKLMVQFEREINFVQDSIKLIKPNVVDEQIQRPDYLSLLEEKSREVIRLKLKNEQLREKELFARLQLDKGIKSGSSSELKQELIRQSEISKDLALQLADVKFKLEQYEIQFDGLTREQIV
jgi:hypothetical protein